VKRTLRSDVPGPARVIHVDLDGELPTLEADDRYKAAMIIGKRHGVPCATLELDLRQEPAAIAAELEELRALAKSTTVYKPTDVDPALLPSMSVVIPTALDRTEDIALLLEGFTAVDYPDVEFIVVDNRRFIPDPDPLPELIRTDPRIRSVRAVRPGVSSARNGGFEAATREIVAYVDDDVRVDPHWLTALGSRYVREPELDAVSGLILPAELEEPAQIWFERYFGGFYNERVFAPVTLVPEPGRFRALRNSRVTVRSAEGKDLRQLSVYGTGGFATGANMSFRRTALERVHGFDLALGTGTPARGGEDIATVMDVLWTGGRIGYEPSSFVHHRHRRSLKSLLYQMDGNGVGFTATLVSLIVHDPRHVVTLAAGIPPAAVRMAKQYLNRLRSFRDDEAVQAPEQYPRTMMTYEIKAYRRGPLAYARSRREMRRWKAPQERTGASETSGTPVAV
jgi:GT2 family glycosyltransferase